jgi:cytochrome P450
MTVQDHQTVDDLDAFDTDLDHHSPYFRENNYAIMRDLQQRCPVAHSSSWGGFWMFTDYESCKAAAHDPELFSNDMRKAVPTAGYPNPLIPIDIDPPLLLDYRRVVLPWFSKVAADRKAAEIQQLVDEMLDDVIESGEADLSMALTTPVPARMILRVLGFDDTRWADWVGWVHNMVHDRAHEPELAMAGAMNIAMETMKEVEARRGALTDDLMSELMRAEIDGALMDDAQLQGFVMLLMLGGMDTTSGLTGNTLVELDLDLALRERLRTHPEQIVEATEEFLRHDTPSQGLSRYVTHDAEFRGRHLKAGDRVLLMYASANRDPAVFDNPDEIDLDRPHNRHMAFALGGHRCLGSNFARLMFQTMVNTVLRRMPDFRVSGELVRYPDAGDVYGVKHLPVTFTPGPRVGAS